MGFRICTLGFSICTLGFRICVQSGGQPEQASFCKTDSYTARSCVCLCDLRGERRSHGGVLSIARTQAGGHDRIDCSSEIDTHRQRVASSCLRDDLRIIGRPRRASEPWRGAVDSPYSGWLATGLLWYGFHKKKSD